VQRFRVQGSGFMGKCSGFRVHGSKARVQVSGFRNQGIEIIIKVWYSC
jgi:hypothetical protein